MTKILYLILPIIWIMMTLGSAQAQSSTSRIPRIQGTIKTSAPPSNASSKTLNIDPAALTNSLFAFQDGNGRELLIFKPVPGEDNARVAEFTTPNGLLRMRAFTNGPNSIRFDSTEQSANLAAMNVNGPGAVGTMSIGAGAKIDAASGVFGRLRDALGRLFGGDASTVKCKTTVTVTIDSNGIASTDIKSTCEKA